MKSYRTVMPTPMWPEQPFTQFCAALSWEARQTAAGSVLVVRCDLREGQSPAAWLGFVDRRDLGFLLP